MQTVRTTFARFTSQPVDENSKDHFADMFDEDYAYATAPLNYPPACQWCDERGIHHPYCPYCDEPRPLCDAALKSSSQKAKGRRMECVWTNY